MRLLALADEPPRGDLAVDARRNAVDVVVTLGDLRPVWLASLAGARLPRIGVAGNHDGERDLIESEVEDVHLRRVEIGGWTFAGFEGCVRYRDGPFQYTQVQAAALAEDLQGADVLVCHCPPQGVNDEPDDPAHLGFAALRAWVERHRPRYVLHGHTTPDPRRRVHRLCRTEVVWVRGARVVELRR